MLARLAAKPDAALRDRLGPELHDAVLALLARRTEEVAGEFGPVRHAERIEDLAALLAGHDGPILLVAPDVPRLSAHHLGAALQDLAAGAVLAFAPGMDGKPFLLALPGSDSLGLLDDGIAGLAGAFAAAGGEVGMVRPERRLATADDARAYAVDPMTPDELRSLLTVFR